MSIKTTTHPTPHEATHDPCPPSNSMAPGPQPPPSFIHVGHKAQSGQPHVFTSPGVFAYGQQGQENVQIRPAITTATTAFTKEVAKTLGAIQIVVGLMHIGFGAILGSMNNVYMSINFVSGNPFLGGLSFIIAGALSIWTSKQFSLCTMKGNLGMNIVSAIFSFIGIILFLVDVSINGHPNQDYWALLAGRGISAMLLIFSLLEFCIACTTAHFACQEITSTTGSILVYANGPTTLWSSLAPSKTVGHPPYATT